MSLIKRVTQDEVVAATVRFLDKGGLIDRTVEFPPIQKKSKSYGQLADERRVRKNKRRQQHRDQEREELS